LALPPGISMICAITVSFIPPVRDFLMNTYANVCWSWGNSVDLRIYLLLFLKVIPTTIAFIGDASIPFVLMFLGTNLVEGLKDTNVPKKIIVSIVLTRLGTIHTFYTS
jgi:hypothetical protein